MNDQVRVPPNRAGKMSVIGLGQAVMAERLRCVARSLQAFQEAYLERLFLRFPGERCNKPL